MSRHNRRAGGRRQGRWDDAERRGPRRPDRAQERSRRTGRRNQRGSSETPHTIDEPPVLALSLIAREEEPPAPACGRCREFLADDVTGRGECLHPGSGILRPWWDTPGCPFFQR